MNDREKLIALIENAKRAMKSENLSCNIARNGFVADFLIANGVTIQRWIPVTERLPENDRQRVLAVCIGDYPIGYPKIDTDRYVRGHWVRYGNDVTHWMPLTKSPKEVE